MSRRDQIRMSADEVVAFLSEQRFGVLGTIGPDGMPHLVNVGYLVVDGQIVFTSFAAAQKVRNLERTGSATFLVEVPWPYHAIKGVMLSGPVRVVKDTDVVVEITTRIRREHAGMDDPSDVTPDFDIARRAVKRVAVFLEPVRVRSWDHSRLAGVY